MKQTKEELWAVASEYYKQKSEGKNPLVQYCRSGKGEWDEYIACYGMEIPNFNDGDIWRLKPETVQHKGGEYPKPCTDVDEMKESGVVYKPSFHIGINGKVYPKAIMLVIDPRYTRYYLDGIAKSGLHYLKCDDAIARAKVIYEID